MALVSGKRLLLHINRRMRNLSRRNQKETLDDLITGDQSAAGDDPQSSWDGEEYYEVLLGQAQVVSRTPNRLSGYTSTISTTTSKGR